jgi:pyridoxine 5'-phosphate synthase PdxJ
MISSSRTALLICGQEAIAILPNDTESSEMGTAGSLVAIFDTREQAESAIRELQKAQIDMSTISIAAKDTRLESSVGVNSERLEEHFGAYCSTLPCL